MGNAPWTALQELKGGPNVLKKIKEAEALLSLGATPCHDRIRSWAL
jgi:hypothetical protein